MKGLLCSAAAPPFLCLRRLLRAADFAVLSKKHGAVLSGNAKPESLFQNIF
jgi:hypothetical protein